MLETVIGVSGIIVGITVPIVVIARLWQVLERIRLLVLGHRATAVVDTYSEYPVGEDRYNFTVTVDFVTRTGQRRVVELLNAVSTRPRMGGRMTVVYRPDQPDYAAALNPVGAVLTIAAAPFLLLLAATVTPIFASVLFDVDVSPLWWLEPFRDPAAIPPR